MAVAADLFHHDGYVSLDLCWTETVARIEDDPDPWWSRTPLIFIWDAERLRRGERIFLGVVVPKISLLREEHLAALDRLDLPRVRCAERGIEDASVAEVLRWVKQTYASAPVATG